ncbi:ABC transporter permease [Myroides marinus]|uniref:SemiSWEET family transporter n=1 Tax=Myroides TaxID=76831 RepID=UPI002578D487|nr:SemiSWEET family transporter [Myroides marinus]MDM1355113.1 ABC transporter permease [Myroides marinus]MDM1362145.1 ABC transporter permease [Myroides marinus]MDM1364236.1 ABC transporter permease [Myroides marinus]MDM1369352.1 ABC transporter permease [Myroides marinus]MDM1374295.1 ABC transporter permease [Myroides marinus]
MKEKNQETKFIRVLGIVATVMSIAMYVSYIPQIIGNLNGNKSDYIQPLVASINCSLWVVYGVKKKDWPIASANAPGVLFGLFACITALI